MRKHDINLVYVCMVTNWGRYLLSHYKVKCLSLNILIMDLEGIFLHTVVRRTATVTIKQYTFKLFCLTKHRRLTYSVYFFQVYFYKNSIWIFNLFHTSKCYIWSFKIQLNWAFFHVNIEIYNYNDELWSLLSLLPLPLLSYL